MRSLDGVCVNALRGLLDAMASLITRYQPTHLACAWDQAWRPSWRVDLLPEYKRHRLAKDGISEQIPQELAGQIPLIREALSLLAIPRTGFDDHEADDVMASLARSFQGEVLIASADRDLFQTVTGRVRVIYLGRGVANHELVNDQWIKCRYGISARYFADFATLRGDPSDGLPGIAGIGEKTAAALISKFGGIPQILAAAACEGTDMTLATRKKLLEGADYLHTASRVVGVVDDLDLGPVERFDSDQINLDGFRSFSDRLNLGRSAGRILAALQR